MNTILRGNLFRFSRIQILKLHKLSVYLGGRVAFSWAFKTTNIAKVVNVGVNVLC